ncbi:MAG: nitrile hydratase subunit alpha, partial [Streptosporangiaceae bacterium]
MTSSEHHAVSPAAARTRQLEERLIAAGLTSDDEIDEWLTKLYASASPVNGAVMVARAWTDPAYRELLLADGSAAAAEAGFTLAPPERSGYQ